MTLAEVDDAALEEAGAQLVAVCRAPPHPAAPRTGSADLIEQEDALARVLAVELPISLLDLV